MIRKRATCNLVDITPMQDREGRLTKTAARKIGLDQNPSVRNIVESEIRKHPTALFFRAKAIVADEMNSNGDLFTAEELRTAKCH